MPPDYYYGLDLGKPGSDMTVEVVMDSNFRIVSLRYIEPVAYGKIIYADFKNKTWKQQENTNDK